MGARPGMKHGEVKKRCVFALTGYEPVSPQRQHERFIRELRRFERTWNVVAKVSELNLSEDGAVAFWHVETEGANWRVETEYRSLRWDDFVVADFARPDWVRIPRAMTAFTDFIISGTAYRYFATNWRYGLFFLYPLLVTGIFGAIAVMSALAAVHSGLMLPLILAPLLAIVVFAGLFRWPGRFMLLDYIYDDWIFAHQTVHKSRPGLEQRLDAFARDVASRLGDAGCDEIIVSGHSLGAALKIDVVDRALALRPEFGEKGETLNLLSTGSSLLKIALHRDADWLRAAVERVCRHKAIFWIEYQALVDVISFYKTNPAEALKLPVTGKPLLRKLRIRNMLDDAVYRRFRGNFFRLHRQLIMGNEKRYFYDFFMICCGPFRLESRVRDPDLMMAAFSPDGGLVAHREAGDATRVASGEGAS